MTQRWILMILAIFAIILVAGGWLLASPKPATPRLIPFDYCVNYLQFEGPTPGAPPMSFDEAMDWCRKGKR
jgi:hypothetical protein